MSTLVDMGLTMAIGYISVKFSDVDHISTNELQNLYDDIENIDTTIILDVREKKEYEVSHLQNARHCSLDFNENKIREILPVRLQRSKKNKQQI